MDPISAAIAESVAPVNESSVKRENRAKPRGIELRLALIDSRTLVRTAVAYLLQTWSAVQASAGMLTVLPFSSVAEFQVHYRRAAPDFDIVALSVGSAQLSDEQVAAEIRGLSGLLQSLPLVLMSDNVQPKAALELLREGLKAYLPGTLSPPIAIGALRLVWAGGTYIPPDLLQYATSEHEGLHTLEAEAVSPMQLTIRQQAVLTLLRQGNPNKIIAAELGITESTVKAYVRQIMKKLGAINRTHACYLLQRSAETEQRPLDEASAANASTAY